MTADSEGTKWMVSRLGRLVVHVLLLFGCGPRGGPWTGDEVLRAPDDDWAWAWTPAAAERYEQKRGGFDCSRLEAYIADNHPWAAFYAIRDASLFGDDRCKGEIAQHEGG